MAILRPTEAADLSHSAVSPCVPGAFIQLTEADFTRTGLYWHKLFRALRQLGVDQLIVQWSAYDDVSFHRARQAGTRAPLEEILQRADQANMRVLIGLAHHTAYWKEIEQADKSAFLLQHAKVVIATATKVAPIAHRHKSFDGWYITEEIDNLHWRDAPNQAALVMYLQSIARALQTLTPGRPMAISAFTNGQTPIQEFEQLWRYMLSEIPELHTVLFQDGVGVGHLEVPQLDEYHGMFRRVTDAYGRRFMPIVELLEQTSALDGSSPFAARPAPLPRVLSQIAAARRYSQRRVAFGVPEYFSPVAGHQSAEAFQIYLRQLRKTSTSCRDAK